MNNGDNSLSMVFQMNSIGFKSGEYGGTNTRLMLSFLAVSVVNGHDEILLKSIAPLTKYLYSSSSLKFSIKLYESIDK